MARRGRAVREVAAEHAADDRGAAEFYAAGFGEADPGDLAEAAELEGVAAEIAVLRVLIKQDLAHGNLAEARRDIDTLCRTLKVQYALDERSADTLAQSISRVLDELGEELGVTL